MKNRKVNLFILIWFIFTQFIGPIQVVSAVTREESSRTNFNIKELSIEEKQANFEIDTDEAVDFDYIKLIIPQDATYDIGDVEHTYDKTNQTIEIQPTNQNKIPIKLLNLKDGKQQLILEVYQDGEVIDTKTHDFTITEKETTESTEAIEPEKNPNELKAPNLQRDLKVVPLVEKIESGKSAVYKVILKLTGSQVYYENLKMTIDLPTNKSTSFTQDVNELKINGVVPTYNKDKNRLEYDLKDIAPGQTYETMLVVNTENLTMAENEQVKVKGSLIFPKEFEENNQTSEGSVSIIAAASMSLSKSTKKITYKDKNSVATPNGEVQWEITVSVRKKDTGQMFLKPGSKITVSDILPKELTYLSNKLVEGTPKAKESGKTLTWTLTAPSIEEQLKDPNYLFSQKLLFWTKIDNDSSLVDSKITNKATVGGTFIDGVERNPVTETSTSLPIFGLSDNPNSGSGGLRLPEHLGPKNADGGRGASGDRNPNPAVYNDAYLQFAYLFFGAQNALNHDMKNVQIIYTIDKDLYLEAISPPFKTWIYGSTTAERNKGISLNDKVDYYYELTYIDKNGKTQKSRFDETYKSVYNLNDMGLEKGDRVTEVRQIFRGMVPKKLGNNTATQLFFTIKPGYNKGYVENTVNVIGESTYNPSTGKYSNGNTYYKFDWNKDFPDWFKADGRMGPRRARIVEKPTLPPPVAAISVNLLKQKDGIVEAGENRLRVTFSNDKISEDSLTKQLESVVLLPPGVKISEVKDVAFKNNTGAKIPGEFEVIDESYNNSGRQLVRFKWDELYIRSNQKLTAEVNVDISDNSPTLLYFDAYGFSGNKTLKVPVVTNTSLTNTELQKDIDDLNKDGKTGTPRIKSSNVYTILNTYDLKTEKFVKGPGQDWSKFAKTTPGGEIDYRLYLTNSTGKDISSMTLIDVLPAGGDLGITDNISRGSKFMPYLSGPIELPQEWQGKVNVYYSTSKTPKRDDLIRYTNYPKGTAKLGNPNGSTDPKWMSESSVKDWTSIRSFKVELIPGVVWIKGVDMNITFKMEAPTVERASDKSIFDPKTDPRERAAWNSFAVATDNGQPVEPQQVGVYIDKDIGELQIKKVDSETGKVLSGAEFEISNEDGSFVKTIVSNDEGIAELEDIPLGKYTIKETKAPNGYNISNKLETFEVTNEEYKHVITIKNQRVKGKLIIKKVDSITGKALSGAEFEVKNSKGEVVKTLTTDEKGLADVSDLADGKYSITEIKAPEGYNILQKPIDFEITLKNPEVTLTVKNTAVGWELPKTGGSGILLSSLIGIMFMSVGLTLVRTRKN